MCRANSNIDCSDFVMLDRLDCLCFILFEAILAYIVIIIIVVVVLGSFLSATLFVQSRFCSFQNLLVLVL